MGPVDRPGPRPPVDTDTFEHAQQILAAHGTGRAIRERHRRVSHPYALRGLLHCGYCTRRMQGNWHLDRAYYRCRYPAEYAIANTVQHPRNVYLAERDVLPALDDWLAQAFTPNHLATTIKRLFTSQPDPIAESDDVAVSRTITDCDAKLARYREALEAGPTRPWSQLGPRRYKPTKLKHSRPGERNTGSPG